MNAQLDEYFDQLKAKFGIILSTLEASLKDKTTDHKKLRAPLDKLGQLIASLLRTTDKIGDRLELHVLRMERKEEEDMAAKRKREETERLLHYEEELQRQSKKRNIDQQQQKPQPQQKSFWTLWRS